MLAGMLADMLADMTRLKDSKALGDVVQVEKGLWEMIVCLYLHPHILDVMSRYGRESAVRRLQAMGIDCILDGDWIRLPIPASDKYQSKIRYMYQ